MTLERAVTALIKATNDLNASIRSIVDESIKSFGDRISRLESKVNVREPDFVVFGDNWSEVLAEIPETGDQRYWIWVENFLSDETIVINKPNLLIEHSPRLVVDKKDSKPVYLVEAKDCEITGGKFVYDQPGGVVVDLSEGQEVVLKNMVFVNGNISSQGESWQVDLLFLTR